MLQGVQLKIRNGSLLQAPLMNSTASVISYLLLSARHVEMLSGYWASNQCHCFCSVAVSVTVLISEVLNFIVVAALQSVAVSVKVLIDKVMIFIAAATTTTTTNNMLHVCLRKVMDLFGCCSVLVSVTVPVAETTRRPITLSTGTATETAAEQQH